MPTISKKSLSAIEAVLYIACKPGQPVRGKEICDYQKVAERYLEPVMQELVHQKILRGVRGPKGGYVLSREKRRILLSEIVSVVESLETKKTGGKSELFKEVIEPVWTESSTATMEKLKVVSIQDLYDSAITKNVTVKKDKADFTI